MARSAKDRIERSHLAIMRHPTFCAWSGLLFIGGYNIDKTLKTARAWANGKVEYGEAFIDACQSSGGVDKEVNYIVLHENGHKALLHPIRSRKLIKKNPQAAFEAIDHVVNNLIEDMDPEHKFAEMPKAHPGYFDRKYKDMSMKEVFDDILKNGGQPDRVPMDEHEFEFQEGDKDDGNELTEAVQDEQLEKEITDALRSGNYLAGKMGGKIPRSLLNEVDPKVDWREVLREFVQDACTGDDLATWNHPNRRFVGVGVYLPSLIGEQIGEIVCAVDTSGSVGQQEMTAMLAEVVSIAKVVKPRGIRLIYWSDGIEGEEYYTPDDYDQLLTKTKPIGGGGTTVGPVADKVRGMKDVQCALVLTDGGLYGGWGDWGSVPVLWAMTTSRVAPFGRTVRIELGYN